MHPHLLLLPLLAFTLLLPAVHVARAQAPGVPVLRDRAYQQRVTKAARELKEAGKLQPAASLDPGKAPKRCALTLPPVRTQPLPAAQVYECARKATLNVGHLYLCTRCEQWHTNLAGGYAVTDDGVVASCFHVFASQETPTREDYLFVADADGHVFAVTELLAADKEADVALVRTGARDREPLPLQRAGRPGDSVFCLSNPKDVQEFFSQGMIARYFVDGRKRTFLHVTTEWAAGSSGAAVLDQCGNALGHVASTRTLLWRDTKPAPKDVQMTLKQASAAAEVIRLTTAE